MNQLVQLQCLCRGAEGSNANICQGWMADPAIVPLKISSSIHISLVTSEWCSSTTLSMKRKEFTDNLIAEKTQN